MAMDTMTLMAEALKIFYLEGLRTQINENASPFAASLEKSSMGVTGSKISMGLQYGRHGGVGNAADDGDLPTANPRKLKKAEWETKNIFARFQITQKVIDASKNDKGAFENLLTNEVKTLEIDAKDNFSRQALGDGTGALCTITGVREGAGNLTAPVSSTDFLAEGMYVDIYDADGAGWLNQAVEITAVDDDSLKVTFSALGVCANADTLYIKGSKDIELTGVKSVFESTTLYGIDRTTNFWLKPNRINVNGEISEIIMQKGIHLADRKAGGIINFINCSYGVQRAYTNLLAATKQISNSIDMKGGFKAISFNGVPLVADKYIASGKMYELDLNDWKMYHMSDWDWMNRDGSMFSRVANKAAYEASLYKFADIGCQRPKAQTELYGITEH